MSLPPGKKPTMPAPPVKTASAPAASAASAPAATVISAPAATVISAPAAQQSNIENGVNIDALKRIALLHCFNEPELRILAHKGRIQTHEAFTNLIIEGELSWGLFLLMDGMVEVVRANQLDGVSYQIAQLQAGSFFGELSLIDSNPRSATVRALTDGFTFYVDKVDFDGFLNEDKDRKLKFFQHALALIATRLREVDENFIVSQYQLWSHALKGDEGRAA
jgi:CRP-like cAMP-binding protein